MITGDQTISMPGSIVGSAFFIFVPNIAEGISKGLSKGLSGAVFGVPPFLVVFVVRHGARQFADYLESIYDKSRKIQRKQNVFDKA